MSKIKNIIIEMEEQGIEPIDKNFKKYVNKKYILDKEKPKPKEK